jgi:hypothetical protein
MEEVFTNIYEQCHWGNNNHSEYSGSSGMGSEIQNNEHTYVPFLKKFITDKNIKTVVDLGCGDFVCGKLIYDDLDVSYTGYDTYKKIIDYNTKQFEPFPKYSFIHLDFCNNKENIINADLCILKDVIMHWPIDSIYSFLDYIVENKKFKYILICNCCDQTEHDSNIVTGQWRQLSCDYYPLKKYNPLKIYNFMSNVEKEVSIIESTDSNQS